MLQQALLERIYVPSALISLLHAESFRLQTPETGHSAPYKWNIRGTWADNVLEHPSSNDEQQLVNKYPSSLCLGREKSEMCYGVSWRSPMG